MLRPLVDDNLIFARGFLYSGGIVYEMPDELLPSNRFVMLADTLPELSIKLTVKDTLLLEVL